ncbi:Dual specificity protein phosphatase 10, partial [Clarias magur]
MPPLPLDERIVVIQRPKSLGLCVASPPATSQSSSRLTTRNEPPPRLPHTQPPPSRPHLPSNSLSLECRHRHLPHGQRAKGERGGTEDSNRIPSHCHSNGTVTLGPRPYTHTHTIDIKVSVDKGGPHLDKRCSSSLTRGESSRESRAQRVSSHLAPGQSDRKFRGKTSDTTERHQIKAQYNNLYQNNLTVSPGGVLEFVPAQRQQSKPRWSKEEELLSNPRFTTANYRDVPSVGNKENSKLGAVHQPPKPQSLSHHLSSIPSAHAAILNTHYQVTPNSVPFWAPSSFPQISQTRNSRIRETHPQILHSLPLSPTSSCEGFPSPDHTCTIDFSRPFNCDCWRLVCCKGRRTHSAACKGGTGSPSSSFSRGQRASSNNVGDGAMGLKKLGGCLSTASTTNTSSSNSTVSECQTGLLRPLGCASCSGEGGAFESPATFRKKLVGGCLPCAPFSPSAPLRALQSCVSGCNPKASQSGSSTCSYCSSDPIVVTFNPHRGKPPGFPHNAGVQTIRGHQHDDDDYSVRTIWPDELAKKMTHSKSQPNHHGVGMRMGTGNSYMGRDQSNGTSPVILDCRNLLEFTRSQLTDHAGRRRLQQGKVAVLDFMGSRDPGQDSLKRLFNKEGDAGMANDDGLDDMFLSSPSHRSLTPESIPSFSPPPSAPGTLIKPKTWGRDWEGGHSLPSAQSLHLVLNSFNREQEEEKRRVHLSLPLSSSLPASLSDESLMTPDVENAVISPILPFLFLGNERDAQDLDLLLRLNISYVVNVTTHLPLYHLETGVVRYKRLPATDNSKQNLRQYFEEVFEFI